MIRWDVPGPYEVVFSTRVGGVSEGPYESLNLGRMTGDDVERVDENRRRLCAEIGAEPERLALNRQVHSTLVHRAVAGARGEPGDGLWTDEPDVPVLAMTADCLPIALVRANGAAPAVAVLHVGWRGLLGGIVAAGVETLGNARACIGPAIGPCCYEVGRGGRRALRRRLRERRRPRPPPRPVDRRRACAERRGCRAGRTRRPLHGVQPGALLLTPPHRQAARRAGRDRACRLRASARAYARIRDEVGDAVTVVVATKYVSLEDMAVLAEAGVEVVGENRAQDLEAQARRVRRRLPLALHRPPAVEQGEGREPALRARALARLRFGSPRASTVPALVEVNLSGEESKSGIAPEELARLPRRSPPSAA